MMGMKTWHRSPKAADITAMLKTLVAMALLRLNGGFSVGTKMRMKKKIKIKRNLKMKMNRAPRMKMNRAPRMKSKMVTKRKVTMKAESPLKQDSSQLKQYTSLLKQDSSQLKQYTSLLKQDSVLAETMTQILIEWNLSEDITLYRSS